MGWVSTLEDSLEARGQQRGRNQRLECREFQQKQPSVIVQKSRRRLELEQERQRILERRQEQQQDVKRHEDGLGCPLCSIGYVWVKEYKRHVIKNKQGDS